MAYDNITIGNTLIEPNLERRNVNIYNNNLIGVLTGEVIDGEPVYEIREVNSILGSRPTSFAKLFTGAASQEFFLINDDPNRTGFIDGRILSVFNPTGTDESYQVDIASGSTADITLNGTEVGTGLNEGKHIFEGVALENYSIYTGTTFGVSPTYNFLRTKYVPGKDAADVAVIAPLLLPPNTYIALKYTPSDTNLEFSITLLAKQNVL